MYTEGDLGWRWKLGAGCSRVRVVQMEMFDY